MSSKPKKKHINLERNTHWWRNKQYIDFDYIDQLSESEKAWLDKFVREYYLAMFDERGNLHKYGMKQECRKAANARAKCAMSNKLVKKLEE